MIRMAGTSPCTSRRREYVISGARVRFRERLGGLLKYYMRVPQTLFHFSANQ
jgi:hypothetical protein